MVTDASDAPGDEWSITTDSDETTTPMSDTVGQPGDDAPSSNDIDASGSDPLPRADVQTDIEPTTESELKAIITAPTQLPITEVGTLIEFAGVAIDDQFAPEALTVTWTSDLEGDIWTGVPGPDGWVQFSHAFTVAGEHVISMVVSNPNAQMAQDSQSIAICHWPEPETFDTAIDGTVWKAYGDAYWDPGGWLEMTGNETGKGGAIYNTGEFINPGNVTIRFKIWTGGGINSGADGFAMSVFYATSLNALETIINEAKNGGCLSYGVSGPCGDMEVQGFHAEFDTWSNDYDPTSQNHMAITLNGDPGNHYLWETIPTIEDQQWHNVEITIEGENITVTLDEGVKEISTAIPGFIFHGGYIGFSGTTGWATNFHRFDDLHIIQQCKVP